MRKIANINQYNKALEFDGVTLVDFYMSWCMPCQKLKPIIEELETELKGSGKKFQAITLEIDTIPALSRKLHVEAVPALFFFIKGEESGKRIVGYKEKSVLKTRIVKELAKI